MIFGLVMMADIGLAIHDRMNLDQSVRAGADFVMKNISSEEDIEKLMVAAATGSYSDNPGDVESAKRPTVDATKWCECPENPGVSVSCTTTLCNGDVPPSTYYKLTAAKTYEALILPDLNLSSKINVQVR